MVNKKSSRKVRQEITSKGTPFTCIFELNEAGGYTVTVPVLPGLVTEGRDLEEAKKMVKKAITLHCECLEEEREPMPREQDIVVGVVHVPLRSHA